MKKIVVLVAIAAIAASAVAAQGMRPGMWNQAPATDVAQEMVKVEGRLSLVNGHPAVTSAGKTYYVRIPGMLYGYLDTLKDGAAVKLEGYAVSVPLADDTFVLQVVKLNVGGKDYDLAELAETRGALGGMGGMGGRMGPAGRSGTPYGAGPGQAGQMPGRGGRW
jgi:hypothetical protein